MLMVLYLFCCSFHLIYLVSRHHGSQCLMQIGDLTSTADLFSLLPHLVTPCSTLHATSPNTMLPGHPYAQFCVQNNAHWVAEGTPSLCTCSFLHEIAVDFWGTFTCELYWTVKCHRKEKKNRFPTWHSRGTTFDYMIWTPGSGSLRSNLGSATLPSLPQEWPKVLLQNGGFCNTCTLKRCILFRCITKQRSLLTVAIISRKFKT